eukprot:INCI15720.2.p1 GENE.INCI15720.2~~INCI15720.2.p1  ORF type:complete len:334 (+),score=53.20 INCI15720.2:33-1034(+)
MAKYVGGAAVGLAAGFTLGCVGWGGAQIIKPSLSKFLGLSTIAANGTSLTSLSAAATTGAFRFGFSDQSDFATAACIAVPSIFGARFGVKVAQKLSSDALALIFNGASVILIPTHFFVQKYREENPHEESGNGLEFFLPLQKLNDQTNGSQPGSGQTDGDIYPDESTTKPPLESATALNVGEKPANSPLLTQLGNIRNLNPLVLQHLAFGGFMGILSALMGVGGAPLCMSYLTVATDLPHHLVQGTMMVAVLPAVLTSAASLAFGGHTPLLVAAAVCCGSTIGAFAGAEFALQLSEEQLRMLYMASLVILGTRSFVAGIGNIRRLLEAARKNK